MRQVLEQIFLDGTRLVDFFFDPKTQIIYFLKSIENKKVKFSTKVKMPDVAKARRIANRELHRRLSRKKLRLSSLVKDELTLWLKAKEGEGHKYDTMNNIRRAKKQIEEYWGDRYPHEITRDNLTLWYQWWAESHSEIQMENAIKYLRNFCRYLAEKTVNGLPLLPAVPQIKDPSFRENRAKRKKKKERIITAAEFATIYKNAPDDDGRVIVLFMYTMATRITETLTLRFEHEVLLGQPNPAYRWTVGQNKADLWGEHFLHPALIAPIQSLKRRRELDGTAVLFPQLRDKQKPMAEQQIEWEAWRVRADIGWHWTPHTFRHTCLSNLFNDSKNAQALICKLYRVSLQTAMEHYIKPTQEGILGMRDAIKVDL